MASIPTREEVIINTIETEIQEMDSQMVSEKAKLQKAMHGLKNYLECELDTPGTINFLEMVRFIERQLDLIREYERLYSQVYAKSRGLHEALATMAALAEAETKEDENGKSQTSSH